MLCPQGVPVCSEQLGLPTTSPSSAGLHSWTSFLPQKAAVCWMRVRDGQHSVTKRVDVQRRDVGLYQQRSSEMSAMHVGGKPAPALQKTALCLQ